MEKERIDTELFDWALFGEMVRYMRRRQGYYSASEFSDAISSRASVDISADTLYKIESGKQATSAMQFFAITITLGLSAAESIEMFLPCACNIWKSRWS